MAEPSAHLVMTEGCEGGLYIGCYPPMERHPLCELGVAWKVGWIHCCQSHPDTDYAPCENVDHEEQRQVALLILAGQRATESGRPVDPIDWSTVLFGYDYFDTTAMVAARHAG